ncbi:hypothetical protein [Pseudogracilibacillus auburnensis]|uniref:hypothetical protein n=1 Tax=Pseudogracilibacillus auburnensis TaxID=1494959 RepID=UPI001A95C19B|nr:hypothetical protein [Pseudogracilibacillus auburnensis]MBO1003467.1 hypothetical protein [Pseudogracilibacillus auburnensis]
MTRFITVSLLLVVFFFGGMSYGAFEKERLTTKQVANEEIEQEVVTEEVEPVMVKEKGIEKAAASIELETVHEPVKIEEDHTVHKTASFFEKIVTSLYEFVIQVMYKIANLFFE